MITRLQRAVEAPPDKPVRPEAADNQRMAQRIGSGPGTWSRDEQAANIAIFDAMSPQWETDRGGCRTPVMKDALARGGSFEEGLAIEIASGTGLLTPLIQRIWPDVVAVDLSMGMLSRAKTGHRLRSDASATPLPAGCAKAVVIGDGPLFAPEVVRLMSDEACLVWSNALGTGAPFYVPTGVLVDAMMSASGREWNVIESEAHWGTWAVLRPASR